MITNVQRYSHKIWVDALCTCTCIWLLVLPTTPPSQSHLQYGTMRCWWATVLDCFIRFNNTAAFSSAGIICQRSRYEELEMKISKHQPSHQSLAKRLRADINVNSAKPPLSMPQRKTGSNTMTNSCLLRMDTLILARKELKKQFSFQGFIAGFDSFEGLPEKWWEGLYERVRRKL